MEQSDHSSVYEQFFVYMCECNDRLTIYDKDIRTTSNSISLMYIFKIHISYTKIIESNLMFETKGLDYSKKLCSTCMIHEMSCNSKNKPGFERA